jgi:hypothetical protein
METQPARASKSWFAARPKVGVSGVVRISGSRSLGNAIKTEVPTVGADLPRCCPPERYARCAWPLACAPPGKEANSKRAGARMRARWHLSAVRTAPSKTRRYQHGSRALHRRNGSIAAHPLGHTSKLPLGRWNHVQIMPGMDIAETGRNGPYWRLAPSKI